jgi:hypothetical protein
MVLNLLSPKRLRDLRPTEQPKPFTSLNAALSRPALREPRRNKAIQSPVRESQVEWQENLHRVSNQLVREGHHEAELVKRQVGRQS